MSVLTAFYVRCIATRGSGICALGSRAPIGRSGSWRGWLVLSKLCGATLICRVRELSVAELLEQVKQSLLEAYANQDVPL